MNVTGQTPTHLAGRSSLAQAKAVARLLTGLERGQIVITMEPNKNAGRGIAFGGAEGLVVTRGTISKDAISWASSSLSR
jgi:hypothetical protein